MQMTQPTSDGYVTVHDLPPHTDVVTWNNSAWPAWTFEHSPRIIVDLRLCDPHRDPSDDNRVFRPEKLAELGVPDEVILAAAASEPEGFVILS